MEETREHLDSFMAWPNSVLLCGWCNWAMYSHPDVNNTKHPADYWRRVVSCGNTCCPNRGKLYEVPLLCAIKLIPYKE